MNGDDADNMAIIIFLAIALLLACMQISSNPTIENESSTLSHIKSFISPSNIPVAPKADFNLSLCQGGCSGG